MAADVVATASTVAREESRENNITTDKETRYQKGSLLGKGM
jgi:hypothetical protein